LIKHGKYDRFINISSVILKIMNFSCLPYDRFGGQNMNDRFGRQVCQSAGMDENAEI